MASVTVTRKHHVSMGNYEWIEFGAAVTADTEVDFADEDFADDPLAFLQGLLDDHLAPQVSEANDLSAEKNTYVQLIEEKK